MSNARAASRKPARGQRASSHHGSSSSHKAIHIDEEVKISVNQSLERFRYSDDKELDFPSSLSSTERAFIHRVAQSLGYISKSSGKGSSRFLTIRKKDGSDKPQPAMPLPLSHNSLGLIRGLRQRFPVSRKELSDLQPSSRSSMAAAEPDSSQDRKRASGRLNSGVPLVPPSRTPSELDGFRRCLPVYQHQQEIVQLIRDHRVVLVLGETGSGKTTQIPQFLLDDCRLKGEPCRIFCTQPRRLAAMAVAERVAAERGESVGQTVGYHIRLESRVSPKTLLTFCTSGVFLRTLMSGDDSLRTVTHVIVDEVHERDGLTDFLLTKMRDVLQKIPSLKLILSSAALDIELFLQYFGSCPVIHLKGRQFEVTELFLEDILRLTGFNNNNDALEYKEETQRKERKQKCLTEWCEAVETSSAGGTQRTAVSAPGVLQDSSCGDGEDRVFNKMSEDGAEQLEPWLQKEMDSCISNIFVDEDQDAFIQLFNLILNESVNVDYTHRETGATPLMVAAGRGFLTQMEQLLNMGADISRKASNGWTALDFAKHFQQTDAEDLLMSSIPLGEVSRLEEAALLQAGAAELSAEEQELLTLYHHSFDDQWVDLDLIMDLLHNICSTSSEGAVLVFLPGYDEIVALRDRVLFDDKRFSSNSDRFQVFTLHSDMQTLDQKKAMKTSPPGVRKIILSTNIAETSITINDVVFVIDSGKVKEKSFDTVSRVSMLKTVWISKASALQRKGRAGRCRPGVCFHLYSRRRFNNMLEYQVPQLLRMPLQELCLQTKLLAPSSCPVADFLSKAPQPPAAHAIRNAVQMLKTIDAMDQYEELTDLGYHLADLPVDPHLGKMVLCAVVLKCLDPILTIACTLAYRDPFVLPTHSSQKRSALHCRKLFTCNTFSDHMALLTAFQGWQKARSDGWGRSFCEKNFLSQATMDMILGMRTQLLGQLRAIGFVQARWGSDIRDVNLNSENWAVVKAALVAGMYPNLVHLNQKTSLLSSNREKKVHFHPTSTLSQLQVKESSAAKASLALPTDWLIYDEMSRGHRMASVRCCSVVTSISVAIFGGCVKPPGSALHQPAVEKDADSPLEDVSDGETEDLAEMKVDDWLVFQLDRQVAGLVFELKQRWQNLFIRRMRCPSKSWSQQDEAIIHTLVSVLGAEEQLAGLQQPTGIGQRPKPMSAYEGPRSCVKNSRIPTNDRCFQTSDQPSTNLLRDDLKSSSSSWWRRTVDSPPDTSCPSSSRQPASPRLVSPSARYFIMKSSDIRNLEISQQKGIWSTTPSNETKLTQAFVGNSLIILIFSVQGSGHFQGYARMTSVIRQNSCQDWGGFNGRTGVFSVEWIHKEKLPFQVTQHIMNPWNDNKKVQISRDGQELEAEAGSRLLSLWTS